MKLLAKLKRILTHALVMPWQVRRAFSKSVCESIATAIAASEKGNRAEIRFVVEGALDWPHLWRNIDARTRAVNLFSDLRIWDTEHNNGVLIYLMLADKSVEIIADRGVNGKVGNANWESICRDMQSAFSGGRFVDGAISGIVAISDLLAMHYPPTDGRTDELPNEPVVM